MGTVVTRFRYGRDPACLLAIALYAGNRWLVKPVLPAGFMHGQFNDVLLIPALLPLVLWIDRRLGWRAHDRMPTAREIALHVLVWAVICEGLGPWLFHQGTADPADVAAYVAGAILAACWWNRLRARAPGHDEDAAADWRELRPSRKT